MYINVTDVPVTVMSVLSSKYARWCGEWSVTSSDYKCYKQKTKSFRGFAERKEIAEMTSHTVGDHAVSLSLSVKSDHKHTHIYISSLTHTHAGSTVYME